MDEFLKMDVFFVVATVGFVVLLVLIAAAIFYIIRLLRTLNHVADTVDEEANALKKDLDEARASVKRGGVRGLAALLAFAGKTGKRLFKKKRPSS